MTVVKELLGSKKFVASVLASALAFAGFYVGFDAQTIAVIVSPLGVFTVSQGMADFGKEKAKAKS